VGERRPVPADRVAPVQRHMAVDRRRIRLVLARLDAGQPGLQLGERCVGQGDPGHPDGGHRVALRLRRALVAELPRGVVPVVGALLRRRLLAGQRGLRAEIEVVPPQPSPARGEAAGIGVQVDRLPLFLGGLANPADERLDVRFVLPLGGQCGPFGRRRPLDQLREVVDCCHGSSSGW
jgi:hypothetical protein